MAPLLERFGTRIDPAYVGWAVGKPSGSGIIQGWFKLADDRPLDPIALLMVVDALPPVTFDLGLPGWAPTLELTAHVRARPAPGWAIVRHATRTISGGQFEEDCEVWDSEGRLVADVPPARPPTPAARLTVKKSQLEDAEARTGLDHPGQIVRSDRRGSEPTGNFNPCCSSAHQPPP